MLRELANGPGDQVVVVAAGHSDGGEGLAVEVLEGGCLRLGVGCPVEGESVSGNALKQVFVKALAFLSAVMGSCLRRN